MYPNAGAGACRVLASVCHHRLISVPFCLSKKVPKKDSFPKALSYRTGSPASKAVHRLDLFPRFRTRMANPSEKSH
jgi:hypothetical protein